MKGLYFESIDRPNHQEFIIQKIPLLQLYEIDQFLPPNTPFHVDEIVKHFKYIATFLQCIHRIYRNAMDPQRLGLVDTDQNNNSNIDHPQLNTKSHQQYK